MKKSLIIILIIVILAGAGYFAYTKGLINLDFLTGHDSDQIMEGFNYVDEQKIISDLNFTHSEDPYDDYSVDLIKGNFATGGAFGARYIAIKKDGKWSILAGFQDDPDCKILKDNNVPTEIYGGPCNGSKSEKWFEFSTLNETLNFKNNIKVTLQETTPALITEYYVEDEALAIKNFEEYVKRDSTGLHLKLADGTWKTIFDYKESEREADYQGHIFEYFFKNVGFYTLQNNLYEGGNYSLINYTTGKETKLGGRPYFSENGKYVISVNSDLEAGYSFNGFELFENKNGELTLLGKYDPKAWGPVSVKWIDEDKLVMKVNTMEVINGQIEDFKAYVELKIN